VLKFDAHQSSTFTCEIASATISQSYVTGSTFRIYAWTR
jgi:hypothetical protein